MGAVGFRFTPTAACSPSYAKDVGCHDVAVRITQSVVPGLPFFADPGEHTDLSATMASRKAEMVARLCAVGPTVFQSDMNASHPENLGRRETSNAWVADSGFCVPWL